MEPGCHPRSVRFDIFQQGGVGTTLTSRVNNHGTQNEVPNIEDLSSEQWRHVSLGYLWMDSQLTYRFSMSTCKLSVKG